MSRSRRVAASTFHGFYLIRSDEGGRPPQRWLLVRNRRNAPTGAQVLPRGTAYQTDAGMCGAYDSVIGMNKAPAVQRFVRKMPGQRLTPAERPATLCGISIETGDATGLATRIDPVRVGGRLIPTRPVV